METEADLHGIHAIHACSFGHYDYHQHIPPPPKFNIDPEK